MTAAVDQDLAAPETSVSGAMRLARGADLLLESLCVALVLGSAAVANLQVFCRYVLDAALPWPEGPGRPSRSAGAMTVLVDGALAAFVERGARRLLTFGVPPQAWSDALVALVKDGRLRRIELTTIDGGPAAEASVAPALRDAGFGDGYRGLTVRA